MNLFSKFDFFKTLLQKHISLNLNLIKELKANEMFMELQNPTRIGK